MKNTVMLTKNTKIEDVVKELQKIEVDEVLMEIDGKENTHMEFSIFYNENRKKFYVNVQPLTYKEERGFASRMYDIFGNGSQSQYLNDVPLTRKSKKAEINARMMINENLLSDMMSKTIVK